MITDGAPDWAPLPGTMLVYVKNTTGNVFNSRALVLLDDASGRYYIHLFGGFVTATALSGPWAEATQVPAAASRIAQELATQHIVDLMNGPADKKLSLKTALPDVIVATTPTEILRV